MVKDVAHLFKPLHQELMETLRALPAEAWLRPTVAPRWSVRDVAAHLLDGDLRNLAAHRDEHLFRPEGMEVSSYADVVSLINSLNATGVAYAARLSTRLLVDLLELTGQWVSEFIQSLDPMAPALFPVAWAGENESKNWMDTGREYTERWHHQMQIRDAVGAALLLDDEWYEPLLWFSVRALPRTYADFSAAEGTTMVLQIRESAMAWSLVREADHWSLQEGAAPNPAATVQVTRDDAWRLFFNVYGRDAAASVLTIEGDRALASHFVHARSVMAEPRP
ncbi:MAG TPA: maleylpyruvate isomerase N-terminal domain-containing protein [Thermoanaerobaculia bacterium]|nr:maleylpyruvate isomerase N-terminal domain-containing protein [Thermoanaerobaculia bacterium]